MIVRQDLFSNMVAGWDRSRREMFMQKLLREFPNKLETVPREELAKQIKDGCKAADILEIKDNDHVYRFLRLRYLDPVIWKRPGAQQVMMTALTDTSVEPSRRLQFVEKNFTSKGPQK
jgi:hypothetical protein